MVGRLSRARATLATATAHCCSSNRLRTRKAHDRSKVYQPTTSAAMRRHNRQPPNTACASPRHERPVKPHPVQLWSSCFSRPAPLVLRLFPVAPKRPARSPAPTAGKNRGAPENAKRRDAFLTFTEEHFAWKTLYAQERPTREGCPQAELCTPVLV